METLEFAPDVSSTVGQFWDAPDQALFTERTLVALTGLSEAYFQRARWSGDGPKFLKIGSRVRYRKLDICAWLNRAEKKHDSWWPDFAAWLGERSGSKKKAPSSLGGAGMAAIEPAPGSYVGEH